MRLALERGGVVHPWGNLGVEFRGSTRVVMYPPPRSRGNQFFQLSKYHLVCDNDGDSTWVDRGIAHPTVGIRPVVAT